MKVRSRFKLYILLKIKTLFIVLISLLYLACAGLKTPGQRNLISFNVTRFIGHAVLPGQLPEDIKKDGYSGVLECAKNSENTQLFQPSNEINRPT